MRIAFLNPTGQIGGAERSLLDIMASLRQTQPDWQMNVITGEAGLLTQACEQMGVAAHLTELPYELARLGDAASGGPAGQELSKAVLLGRLAFAGAAAARYTRTLRSLLSELQPDLIHTNGFKMHALGAWAKPSRVPLVWHLHDYVSSRVVMTKLLRIFGGRCSAAIANSASVADDFRSTLKPRAPIHKVWNAVDLREFSPEGPKLDLDSASGLPPAPRGAVRVGLVGTLAKWKGHETFLRALSMLPSKLPFRGYIVGGPLYQTDSSQWHLEELQEKAVRFGLAGQVGFTGFIARPAEAMRSLDIVVHASTTREPFGLIIIEAMACGRALIASRAGGAQEIFRDGVNALSHKPGDAEELSYLIETLAGDSLLRDQLGRNGRQTAEDQFDRTRLGRQLAPIFQSIVSQRSAQAA